MTEFSEHDVAALVLSAYEQIRLSRWEPVEQWKSKVGSLDTTAETVYCDRLEDGYVYVIQAVTAIEEGTGTPTLQVGYESGGVQYFLQSYKISTARDSLTWVGQVIAREGTRFFAIARTAVAGDTLKLFVSGYRIKQ